MRGICVRVVCVSLRPYIFDLMLNSIQDQTDGTSLVRSQIGLDGMAGYNSLVLQYVLTSIQVRHTLAL